MNLFAAQDRVPDRVATSAAVAAPLSGLGGAGLMAVAINSLPVPERLMPL